MVINGHKWSKMVINGRKRSKMVKNGQKWSKLSEKGQFANDNLLNADSLNVEFPEFNMD